ncbi:transketolase [Priestia megaterium]|uniref:transketolase n=1 Tax=Priestia megaterium TaxID=1404 RepID=UPI002E1AF74F|nr:transketolase [Priestia megaterium]
MTKNVEQLAVNTIRTLSIDAINEANSGHPGLPMGAAPMAYTLFSKHLNHNPKNSKWFNRDRFVLSAGHGSMLLYSLLHLSGYNLSLEDVKSFRKLNSKTPGHPEFGHTDGVEATTGPLGQGISTAVGMAMAEEHLRARYNKKGHNVVDHYTYALVGDGCLMEGVAYEAASMAGHMKLDRLIVLYDSNNISLDGELKLSFSEDVKKRFESSNWQYLKVEDGNDLAAIEKAIAEAKKNTTQPTIIEVRTTIGFGSPKVAGTSKAHGNPLGEEEAKATKQAYGWNYDEKFFVPAEVKEHFANLADKGAEKEEEWNKQFASYKKAFPELAEELEKAIRLEFDEKEVATFETGTKVSTRNASGSAINFFAEKVPYLFGGSADLSGSTITDIKGAGKFAVEGYDQRNVYFGVREHAMGAALNGMALHGGVKPFGGTFFVFNDYLRPAIRLASIQKLPVTYVFTHDSIAVGEDGPTHEPVEQLASLRAIPGLTVIRPSDANETASAWAYSLSKKDEPVALVLSRQNLEVFEETKGNVEALSKGAYVLKEAEGTPEVIFIATGSEVELAVKAREELVKQGVKGVRVVAMPSWELFEKQSKEYKESILPSSVKNRVAIEMGTTLGWERYVGLDGAIVGIDTFGASGPGAEVLNYFGFTVDNVVAVAKGLVTKK